MALSNLPVRALRLHGTASLVAFADVAVDGNTSKANASRPRDWRMPTTEPAQTAEVQARLGRAGEVETAPIRLTARISAVTKR